MSEKKIVLAQMELLESGMVPLLCFVGSNNKDNDSRAKAEIANEYYRLTHSKIDGDRYRIGLALIKCDKEKELMKCLIAKKSDMEYFKPLTEMNMNVNLANTTTHDGIQG